MKHWMLALGVVLPVTIVSTSLSSAEMPEKDKCLAQVALVEQMKQDEPEVGEKSEAKIKELMEVATHLCEQGNFVYAGKLTDVARGMLVSE